LYEKYVEFRRLGRKKEAKIAIRAFLNSFHTFSERQDFSKEFLERLHFDHPRYEQFRSHIRHELYQEVILPVLLDGYRKKDPWSLYWLASTHVGSELVDDKAPLDLMKECFDLERGSTRVRNALLSMLLAGFEYSAHEWPSGILWDSKGATLSQCDEILSDIQLARELDADGRYSRELDDYERKIRAHRARLQPTD
jgi:hypothetical protein